MHVSRCTELWALDLINASVTNCFDCENCSIELELGSQMEVVASSTAAADGVLTNDGILNNPATPQSNGVRFSGVPRNVLAGCVTRRESKARVVLEEPRHPKLRAPRRIPRVSEQHRETKHPKRPRRNARVYNTRASIALQDTESDPEELHTHLKSNDQSVTIARWFRNR